MRQTRRYSKKEREEALWMVASHIEACERIWPRVRQDTPQYSLLRTRVRALFIAQEALAGDPLEGYTGDDLASALIPLESIARKNAKALTHTIPGTEQFARLSKIVRAMEVSRAVINERLWMGRRRRNTRRKKK